MSLTTLPDHNCRICNSKALHEFERYPGLARVTSDSRAWRSGGRLTACCVCGAVQKLVEPDWQQDINQIYQTYAIYHQAGGKEQPIFAGNGAAPIPRSMSLLKYLDAKLHLQAQADVLDFGCGTGSALRTYAEFYPEWRLYGAELSELSLETLQKIPRFTKLFTCPPAEIGRQFDLVTLIHALEHVLDPVDVLRDLSGLLNEDAVLFVEVPDGGKSPYDLVIADHLLHFSLDTLRLAAMRAGCDVIEVTDTVLPKELSMVARAGNGAAAGLATAKPQAVVRHVEAQIDWLINQIAAAETLSGNNKSFGIFGTSISATWLAGILGDRVAFFVDEDKGRIGGKHIGRPVFSAAAAPAGADVFVPLIPNVAASVVQRLTATAATFHAPAPIGR